jgi:sugar-phosphatase
VLEALQFFTAKGLKIGLATSSYSRLIDCVLNTLNIRHYFTYTHSAEHEQYGKPHPAVYLHVAEVLQLNPQECLVVEDSFTGVIAGKAARMFVVCIPEKSHHPDNRLIAADRMFDNLNELVKEFN